MRTNISAKNTIRKMRTGKSEYWEGLQKKHSIQLFKKTYKNVAAYRKFMNIHNVKSNKIKLWDEFQSIPTISKKNYLQAYPREELICSNRSLEPSIFTSTSGSTGKPFFFLRNNLVDWRCSIFMEDFIRQEKKDVPKTLVIICFGMGVWIAGLITFRAFDLLSRRNNFPISIITPGINKKEILNILQELTPDYDQVLFAGYPPFIKDIIDEAEDMKLPFLESKKIKIKFAAEAISEGLRDYIAHKTHMKNIYTDTVNIYGSADIGAMAVENTTSILIKRLLNDNKKAFQEIFRKTNRVPTLAQYNPEFVSFESINGNILLTGDSTIPLVRYEIGDKGGVYTFKDINMKLKDYGINLRKEAKHLGIEEHITEMPFVYIYERDDLSTTLYGLWIYPEWIRKEMYHPQLQEHITGKFTILTKFDTDHNQYIELNIEMKKNVINRPELQEIVLQHVLRGLKANSSEYSELITHIKERAHPQIKFWPYEDPTHFKPGIKQKWIKK